MNVKFHNGEFPISACRIGTVIQRTSFTTPKRTPTDSFGHIVGFGKNTSGELLMTIQLDETEFETFDQHPSGLILHV